MMTRVGLGLICCLAAVAAVALPPGIVAPVAAQTLRTLRETSLPSAGLLVILEV